MAEARHDPLLRSVWLAPPRSGAGNQPAGLSRDLVVSAAVEVLDGHGLGALSMRKLAAQLGVAPMSLYWHVPTKDALLELALDAVHGEVAPVPAGVPWRETVPALLAGTRALFRRHPWLAALQGRYPNIGPRALALTESLLAALRADGMSVAEAGRAASTLTSYAVGFVVAELKWFERVAVLETHAQELKQEWVPRVVGLVEESFPHFADQLRDATLWSTDTQFDYGVACVVAGIASGTGRVPGPAATP
ncbi:TetR/AcrR family transcriptional regulator [Umezawaea beigongshangensis]|uniref:TetR/AcrR family transcriptional regulator n=1 Tax=Umezawaea beigongshangensis TaxID=2780383 RepID=UPI0018F18F69|nr:TetR/AcrR family transcriptional regulator [Umezawaea beigongshangensis]